MTQWISATETQNHLLRDPLLDWLNRYGEERGFSPDDKLPGYDERTDFQRFLLRKGEEFESRIRQLLGDTLTIVDMARTNGRPEEAASRTAEVLRGAPEAVAQACVADEHTHTFGLPDLLERRTA